MQYGRDTTQKIHCCPDRVRLRIELRNIRIYFRYDILYEPCAGREQLQTTDTTTHDGQLPQSITLRSSGFFHAFDC